MERPPDVFALKPHAPKGGGLAKSPTVLDTIESLVAGLKDDTILRAELRWLFRWLKDKGVTVLVTGERGEGLLTRQGLEEYVSDAVILLDHRVHDRSRHAACAWSSTAAPTTTRTSTRSGRQ